MDLNSAHIKKAYLYLKSYAYHENLNLFIKQRVGEFETENLELEQVFERIADVVNSIDFHESDDFQSWVDNIDYYLLPKLVERKEDHQQNEHNKNKGLFISNVRDSDRYQVSRLNYFINAPVELHIMEMLWCLYAAPALETSMTKDSYGNRMHSSALYHVKNAENTHSQEIFRRYIDQYNQWRDQAIQVATEISKDGDDVALLSLDLQSYFYHVNINFQQILEAVENYYEDAFELRELALQLTRILEHIYKRYNHVIQPRIKHTHANCTEKSGLPIGFASSSIIANWYLTEFDQSVGDNVRPAYYGRYVDDIIMVFKRPKFDIDNPIQSFVNHYLKSVLSLLKNSGDYVIDVQGNQLPIQKEKLILQFFDKEHSRAGLEVFKQELDERSSAFKFLPSEHIDRELDKFAYDVLYDGSANKLRSIVGLAENETELAKYLSSHITAHRLCKLDKKDTVLLQVKQFFKGQNALQFYRLWEKLYQYALVTRNYSFVTFFYKYLEDEINKIHVIKPDSTTYLPKCSLKLQQDLALYNSLALAITAGLLDLREVTSEFKQKLDSPNLDFNELATLNFDLYNFSLQFRNSNLIRHHLVAWPLANFSDYNGDLTNEAEFITNSEIEFVNKKLELSPRFIHFDEWQLFDLGKKICSNPQLNEWIEDSIKKYKSKFFGQNFSASFISEDKDNIVKSHLIVGGNDVKDELKVALANFVVNEADIAAAVRKDCSPNLSFDRQEKLYGIMNSALSEKADLLVMPEVSIPVSWLPFMIAFSRRHQIGLIFGLEHWVAANNLAYNLIIEALPFKGDDKYKSCVVTARIKNHYAPSELELLESIRLKPGNLSLKDKTFYHKVSWRGVSFATYNCFELSDITHRVLFKSEIDLLVACVWNKDTNYYQHILESSVRDLHCYTVQANTSQYGGSCVLRPTKTESKTMLYVKGGENSCVLTTKLSIKGLRDFQYKSKPNSKDSFKHLPPGYDSDAVLKRLYIRVEH